mmetsp:Transcript_23900/g.80238  ORF Transcript_23900/g.80238 Transcript_23900/m.80238 type:complete len:211 (+) Transcript_23900:230-862(+)
MSLVLCISLFFGCFWRGMPCDMKVPCDTMAILTKPPSTRRALTRFWTLGCAHSQVRNAGMLGGRHAALSPLAPPTRSKSRGRDRPCRFCSTAICVSRCRGTLDMRGTPRVRRGVSDAKGAMTILSAKPDRTKVKKAVSMERVSADDMTMSKGSLSTRRSSVPALMLCRLPSGARPGSWSATHGLHKVYTRRLQMLLFMYALLVEVPWRTK